MQQLIRIIFKKFHWSNIPTFSESIEELGEAKIRKLLAVAVQLLAAAKRGRNEEARSGHEWLEGRAKSMNGLINFQSQSRRNACVPGNRRQHYVHVRVFARVRG